MKRLPTMRGGATITWCAVSLRNLSAVMTDARAPPRRRPSAKQNGSQRSPTEGTFGHYLISDKFLSNLGFDLGAEATRANQAAIRNDPDLADIIPLEMAESTATGDAPPLQFDTAQRAAMDAALQGKNLFVTGGAGTGKTLVIREIVQRLRLDGKKVAVMATTGVAALNCGGSTIHHFCGISMNLRDLSPELLADKIVKKKRVVRRFAATDVIVIDEVSMMESKLLEQLNGIAQAARGNFGVMMGGLQVILCGDFLQLPPVSSRDRQAPYAFFSQVWTQLNLTTIVLSTKFRQKSDDSFQKLLDAVREAKLTEAQSNLLQSRVRSAESVSDGCVRLYGSNKEVDARNLHCFAQLRPRLGEPVTADTPLCHYHAVDARTTIGAGIKMDDGRFASVLPLKVNTKVMLLHNLCVSAGLVNGTVGTVTGFLHPLEALLLVNSAFRSRRRDGLTEDEEDFMNAVLRRAGIPSPGAAMKLFDSTSSRTFFGILRCSIHKKSAEQSTLAEMYTPAQVTDLLQVSSCTIPVDAALTMPLTAWQRRPEHDAMRFPIVVFDTPNIKTHSSLHVLVAPLKEEWYIGEEVAATRCQLPLRHSWALTVHKSQGLTIRNLAVDMRVFFAPGQAYVALSRGVSLDELSLMNFNPRGIFACPVASQFYAKIGVTSAEQQAAAQQTVDDELGGVPDELRGDASANGAQQQQTLVAEAAPVYATQENCREPTSESVQGAPLPEDVLGDEIEQ